MTSIAIRTLRFNELRIPFRQPFRHAAAERAETSSIWVEATSAGGLIGYGEACPRPYVTGESLATAQAFFERHHDAITREISDLESLRTWMQRRVDEINANPAAWCAIELALLDLFARGVGAPVESLLGLPPLQGRFRYSAILGDADDETFQANVARYRQFRFRDFKVKLSGNLERDRTHLGLLREDGLRLRADANNLWRTVDEAARHLAALHAGLFAIEEPLSPGRYVELTELGERLSTKIVLDESLTNIEQITLLPGSADRWIVNVRVSKMGGLLRSIALIEACRARGIGVVVGAQVGETSLLTRAGITAAYAARDILVAQEGAFGTLLLKSDPFAPVLTFGAGGWLDTDTLGLKEYSGFGLRGTSLDELVSSESAAK